MQAGQHRVAVEPTAPGTTSLDRDLLPPPAGRERTLRPVVKIAAAAVVTVAAAAALIHAAGNRPPASGRAMVDARYAETALEAFATVNGGVYTGATVAELRRIAPELGDVEIRVSASSYLITASAGERSYSIARSANGAVALTCAPPGTGSCPASGVWR